MTHGALFNGIAGFPLAGRWAGIETLWTVEIDEFCNKVSKKHFPNAIQYTDIHECHNLPYVDIISGGFPCQPFSVAGKQLGNEDDRALWPQMLRVIREVKPAYVIGENVTGIINLALDEVLASLEAEGYTTETFVVPAAGVGAPHRRDRVWIVAYANDRQRIRQEQALCSRGDATGLACEAFADTDCINWRQQQQQRCGTGERARNKPERCYCETASYSDNQRREECSASGVAAVPGRTGGIATKGRATPNTDELHSNCSGYGAEHVPQQQTTGVFPMPVFRLTESPVRGTDDGLPSGLVRNRTAQLKAYGNAIVPQVAYQIFEAIKQLSYTP